MPVSHWLHSCSPQLKQAYSPSQPVHVSKWCLQWSVLHMNIEHTWEHIYLNQYVLVIILPGNSAKDL